MKKTINGVLVLVLSGTMDFVVVAQSSAEDNLIVEAKDNDMTIVPATARCLQWLTYPEA